MGRVPAQLNAPTKTLKTGMMRGIADSLIVSGSIESSNCDMVIDTGSNITIVRPDVLGRVSKDVDIGVQPVDRLLRTVTGETTPVRGRGKLTFQVGNLKVVHEVWVADIENECILGLDFLTSNDCVVDVRESCLHIGPEEIRFKKMTATKKPACCRVMVAETWLVPPKSETIIPGVLAGDSSPEEGWGEINPSKKPGLSSDILVARAVVDIGKPIFAVRVLNMSDDERIVREGTDIASCEIIDSVTMMRKTERKSPDESDELPEVVKKLYEHSSEGLDGLQKNQLYLLLAEFKDVFSVRSGDIGRTSLTSHKIDTGDQTPIKQQPRRLPLAKADLAQEAIKGMHEQGIIEPSNSPWAAPIVLVRKKDGTHRFCVDYRKLNDVTKKDSYPLPRIDTTLDALAGSKWFSTLDMKSGYWQVDLEQSDREKTAFSTGYGLWQFTVMPFGLCNAPATFERLMELVLAGLPWSVCLLYLDDILVHGKTFEEEILNLREVFGRFRAANLKLNAEKCKLFRQKVQYLGHIVTQEGILTEPSKIEAVTKWPRPTNKRDLRGFLGLCSYYRRFIKSFADIASPLHKLTKKEAVFDWSPECNEAFEELKRLLTTAPVLAYPIPSGTFTLDTDASQRGIGAVLSQEQIGREKVIAYFSRSLNRRERNYCVTRKELLAVVKATEKFHYYLYGRRFVLRTDHASLKWLLNFRHPEGQIARWLQKLQEYDFEIVHRAGRSHVNADALSRRPCYESACKFCSALEDKDKENEAISEKEERGVRESVISRGATMNQDELLFQTWTKEELRAKQEEDSDIRRVMDWKANGRPEWEDIAAMSPVTKSYWAQWASIDLVDGILYRRWEDASGREVKYLYLTPKALQDDVLRNLHDSPTAGHFGVKKTLARVRQRFYWINLRWTVENWCRKCLKCASRKGYPRKPKTPLKLYTVGAPMERIAVDVLGPLPKTDSGNQYILIAQDYFTKWPEAFALPNQQAATVAEVLVNQFFTRFGIPMELHSDQGRNFESETFREVCRLLGINKTRTTPYHPQSDGMVERFNKTIEDGLAMFVNAHQTDWDMHIPLLLMAYRSAEHTATKISPSRMMLGREMKLPIDVWAGRPEGTDLLPGNPLYAQKLQEKMDEVHMFARDNLKISSAAMKRRYDMKAAAVKYDVGSGVWLHNPQRKKGRSPKLSRSWEGPYVVVKQINDVVVRIKKGPQAKPKVVHINRLKPYVGEESFGWFMEKKSTGSGPSQDLNIDKSTLPGVTTTSKKDNGGKGRNGETTVELLRRSKRTRKQPQRYTP